MHTSPVPQPPEVQKAETDSSLSPAVLRTLNQLMSMPKKTINTWDVFDTLIARYCYNPLAVFAIVAARQNFPGFPALRRQAQYELDKIGAPYVIFDIYRQMRHLGLDAALAESLLREELAVEMEQAIPIRRNVERVEPYDIMVSDMYLPSESIADLLRHATTLHNHHPIVAGNWGKASGKVWPELLNFYHIRKHHGDNNHSDITIPQNLNLETEWVQDHQFTAWEQALLTNGEADLAKVLRECRLRSIPPQHHAVHDIVCGPFLMVLLLYAIEIYHAYRTAPAIAFCSRDCDQLASIFRALFPTIPTFTIDLNRRLVNLGAYDEYFSESLPSGTVIVDLISTGRSMMGWFERAAIRGVHLHTLIYLDVLLNQPELDKRKSQIDAGVFSFHHPMTTLSGHHYFFEALLQPGYGKVVDVTREAGSGAVIRRYDAENRTPAETKLLEFKSFAIANLLNSIRQRRPLIQMSPQLRSDLLRNALVDILSSHKMVSHFPTMLAQMRSPD